MGTHCFIAIENIDGTIRYIYCNFYGYITGVGKILFRFYKNRRVVTKLIERGSITSLEVPINDMKRSEPTETCTASERYTFVLEFYNNSDISYYYLFTKENEWVCKVKEEFYLSELFAE
jgi:hypothetical protein